jgi:hypothetical protein
MVITLGDIYQSMPGIASTQQGDDQVSAYTTDSCQANSDVTTGVTTGSIEACCDCGSGEARYHREEW